MYNSYSRPVVDCKKAVTGFCQRTSRCGNVHKQAGKKLNHHAKGNTGMEPAGHAIVFHKTLLSAPDADAIVPAGLPAIKKIAAVSMPKTKYKTPYRTVLLFICFSPCPTQRLFLPMKQERELPLVSRMAWEMGCSPPPPIPCVILARTSTAREGAAPKT